MKDLLSEPQHQKPGTSNLRTTFGSLIFFLKENFNFLYTDCQSEESLTQT